MQAYDQDALQVREGQRDKSLIFAVDGAEYEVFGSTREPSSGNGDARFFFTAYSRGNGNLEVVLYNRAANYSDSVSVEAFGLNAEETLSISHHAIAYLLRSFRLQAH